ncbi:MAG: HlyD family secretion protein [Pirellulaceae bacterium]
MIALTTLIYVGLILVFYKVLKIKPNPTNVATCTVIGVVVIGSILVLWQFSAPPSSTLVVSRYTIQLVPQVKGPISRIYADPNVPLKRGEDKLFEVQPDLYELAVEQLTASLSAAKNTVEQSEAAVRAAEAASKKAKANMAAAQAELEVAQETAKINPDAISRLTVTQLTESFNAAEAAVEQAAAGEDQATAGLAAAQDTVRSLDAQLATAQFNLEQCVVYAPADGFVTNWALREGTMATSLPLAPVGTFIDTSRLFLVASFPQNIVRFVKPGDKVEFALKTRPGEIFSGSVNAVIQATGEGQMLTSGQLVSAADLESSGMFVVRFDMDDEEAAQSLALGTAGNVVIYTDRGKPFQVISKVVIRMNAWTYYLLPF